MFCCFFRVILYLQRVPDHPCDLSALLRMQIRSHFTGGLARFFHIFILMPKKFSIFFVIRTGRHNSALFSLLRCHCQMIQFKYPPTPSAKLSETMTTKRKKERRFCCDPLWIFNPRTPATLLLHPSGGRSRRTFSFVAYYVTYLGSWMLFLGCGYEGL